jgi:hypothetical protein
MGEEKLGGNSIDSNSLRDGNLFTKINQYMQLSIFNAKTIFQLSIGKM